MLGDALFLGDESSDGSPRKWASFEGPVFPDLDFAALGDSDGKSDGKSDEAEKEPAHTLPVLKVLSISQLKAGMTLRIPEGFGKKLRSWQKNSGTPLWHGPWRNHGCILLCDFGPDGHRDSSRIPCDEPVSLGKRDLYHCTHVQSHWDQPKRLVLVRLTGDVEDGVIQFFSLL